MKKIALLTGQRFGRLLVIQQLSSPTIGLRFCLCLCDCGEVRRVYRAHLLDRHTRSCGCANAERKQILGELSRRRDLKGLWQVKQFGIDGYLRLKEQETKGISADVDSAK